MYLKNKQHYINRYDELTVEKCRRLEKIHQEGLKKDPPKVMKNHELGEDTAEQAQELIDEGTKA